ncbi:hypothetical protein B0A48_05525 [Cryoendolithus antarcticus]|uniref:Zn(2)-C6 fungal-type domain-containing protein n=1 Tax=Cryoendolithus antarcticus TaxID=1507870 RepID=A0A1V8TIR2_9PEZI|nr:hypothetical protein B0A48_05525 [Cryoendolithus antarcticus]
MADPAASAQDASAPQSYPSPTQATRLPFYPENGETQQSNAGANASEHAQRALQHEQRQYYEQPPPAHMTVSPYAPPNAHAHPSQPQPYPPAMGAPQLPFQSPAQQPANNSADPSPKVPRTKVSRACDSCRRKKIRCDAPDESAATSCSNCVRARVVCEFSRAPMKRGPSKGYIKELAERLMRLEGVVQEPGGAGGGSGMGEIERMRRELEMEVGDMEGRGEKRGWGMVEGGDEREYDGVGMRQAPMASMAQQQQGGMQPFWRPGPQEQRQEVASAGYEGEVTSPTFDWDEEVLAEYHRLIHQTFPLLPSNNMRLRHLLTACPASLREAFLTALDCLVRTFPTTTLTPSPAYAQSIKRAAELLAQYPFDAPATHNPETNLVYLQTLLIMAMESDNHGPATIRGQAGPSRAEWLGRAAGVAGQIQVNAISASNPMTGDRDSSERLARRAWWILFILDRWHASSTADLLKLPENSVVLLPEDQILLGESTYHLARLSFIIGHLASILTTTKTPSTDVMAPSNPASALLGLTLSGEIDRFRESVESVWGSLNLVHLSYHHVHLLIKRLSPSTSPPELIGHAVKVATVLNSKLTPVTPLNHHFGALAAMTLCELADVETTRQEAGEGLRSLEEALGEGRGLAGKVRSEGWDGAVRGLVVGKREKLARGERGGEGGGAWDPTGLTRFGYLNALGLGVFRSG